MKPDALAHVVYEPLSEDESMVVDSGEDTQLSKLKADNRPWQMRTKHLLAVIGFLLLTNLISLGKLLHANSDSDSLFLFSPAQDAIDYKIVKFHSGPLNNEPDDIYSMAPSPEVDQAWRDLYEFGVVSVSADIASKVISSTEKMVGTEHYVYGIHVFHQLHCLNMIRKALHPDYYGRNITGEGPELYKIHLSHCINSVRQSLQCSADVSVVPFNVQNLGIFTAEASLLPTFNAPHKCRDFKKLSEWARARWAGELIDEL